MSDVECRGPSLLSEMTGELMIYINQPVTLSGFHLSGYLYSVLRVAGVVET